jgi:enoyl-CoA hydratase/carnithine racemase
MSTAAASGISGRIDFHTSGAVAWLTLENSSRLNAISLAMWEQIGELATRYEQDQTLRCLVIRGAGSKAFAAGADISEFDSLRQGTEAVRHYDLVAKGATARLKSNTKPTVAAIQGYCIGGGLALALSCDIRIAADDSRFAIPAAKLGLGYDYAGIKRLVDVVGPARAKLIFFAARQFNADEAKSMGLIEAVVPKSTIAAEVDDLVSRIVENAPLTIAAAKQAIATTQMTPQEQDIAACDASAAACFASEDYSEGRRAFAEKRKPIFRGR